MAVVHRFATIVVRTGDSAPETLQIEVVPNPEDEGKTYLLGGEEGFSYQTSEYLISGAGLFDPDPEISYGLAVIDFGAPTSFGFQFGQPIVPIPAPGVASHTYSGSLTDGGSGSVTLTALAPPGGVPVDTDGTPEMSVYTLSTDGGATLLSAELDLGTTLVVGGASSLHGPFNPPAIPGPAGSGSYDYMQVDVNFSLSGGGDLYTSNGRAVIIPEPTAAVIAGMGLLGLSAFRRRRV